MGAAAFRQVGFAAGCFWGKEYHLSRRPGVHNTRVGYAGGHQPHPSYQQVCQKTTGHAETVLVSYAPDETDFRTLCRYFLEMHDPTIDRRGKGGQYRSAIFYTEAHQRQIAQELIDDLKARGYAVTTEIAPLQTFWPAEQRHQRYCERKGFQPRDHYQARFDETTPVK